VSEVGELNLSSHVKTKLKIESGAKTFHAPSFILLS
jgi:hypothetical protein